MSNPYKYKHLPQNEYSEFEKVILDGDSVYSIFICAELKNQDRPIRKTEGFVVHHIWPLHMGGTNFQWNKIYLTRDEHLQAHELLALLWPTQTNEFTVKAMGGKIYNAERVPNLNLIEDKKWGRKLTTLEARAMQKKSVEVQRANQTGCFSYAQQVAAGKKGGSVQSAVRDASIDRRRGAANRALCEGTSQRGCSSNK
jgi:hypothetical protein